MGNDDVVVFLLPVGIPTSVMAWGPEIWAEIVRQSLEKGHDPETVRRPAIFPPAYFALRQN